MRDRKNTNVPFRPSPSLVASCATSSSRTLFLSPTTLFRNGDDDGATAPAPASCVSLYRSYRDHYYDDDFVPSLSSSRPDPERLRQFIENVIFTHEHNERHTTTASDRRHAVGLNQFSDCLKGIDCPIMAPWTTTTGEGGDGRGREETTAAMSSLAPVGSLDEEEEGRKWSVWDLTKAVASADKEESLLHFSMVGGGETLRQRWHRRRNDDDDWKMRKTQKRKKQNGPCLETLSKLGMKVQSTTPADGDDYKTYLNWATEDNPDGVVIVHPPVDQGSCGSCWAFSATGTLEASVARNTAFDEYSTAIKDIFHDGADVNATADAIDEAVMAAQAAERDALRSANLSVQELLDCDSSYDQGCAGGNPFFAYYFIHRFGLTRASDYPYTADEGLCQVEKVFHPLVSVESWGALAPNFEDNMELVLKYVGPIAVGLNGADPSFLHYKSGVYNNPDCAQSPNHAMLLVGYGQTFDDINNQTQRYWIARNSWGTGWGESGYVRMARGPGTKNTEGLCGIAQSPSVALGGFFVTGKIKNSNTAPRLDLSTTTTSRGDEEKSIYNVLRNNSVVVMIFYGMVMFLTFLFVFQFLVRRQDRREGNRRRRGRRERHRCDNEVVATLPCLDDAVGDESANLLVRDEITSRQNYGT